MANLIPDNIQTLLSTFKFDLDDDCINEDLSCTICKKLLNDAYQSFCGCKYCHKCIVSYINVGNKNCPGGKEECRDESLIVDESVLPNVFLNKKVLKVRVCCPNESCQFVSMLTQMEDHLRLCSHQPMECPFTKIGCANERVNRDTVETHLNKDMLAHSQMLIEVVDNLKNEVGGLKEQIVSLREECKLKKMKIQEERRIGQELRGGLTAGLEELKREVAALAERAEENQQRLKKLEEEGMELRLEIVSERQEWRKMIDENEALKKEVAIERKESKKMSSEVVALKKEVDIEREELKKMSGEIVALKKEMGTKIEESKKFTGEIQSLKKEMENKREESRKMSGEIEALKKEVFIEKEKSKKMTGEIVALRNEVGTKREESRKVKDEIEVLQRDMNRIDIDTGIKKKTGEEAAGIIDGRVGELMKTVDSLSKWINKGDVVGSLWFKVDGFDELRRKGGSTFSPHLYSHINGYKLRIKVSSSNGYLGVYSVICKGEYDDVLSWPARGLSVSVNIINHDTKEEYKTVTIKYDNHKCNKPIEKDNQPYGWTLGYVSLSDLASIPGIIVSDSLLLLVTASPP